MYIFLPWGSCFFCYSSEVLVAVYGNDAFGGGQLHIEITQVKDRTENVCDPSAKNCVLVVQHVNHVESYVLCPAIVLIPKDYWECDFSYRLHLLAPKSI